jgi:hypothetical protein
MVMNMKKAEIIDSVVTNIIEVDPDNIPDWCADWPEAAEDTSIGMIYKDGNFFPAPAVPPTREEQKALRLIAYRDESDPIFFKAQRGEATMDEWLAKVAEIDARYPYPEEQP